MKALPIAWTLLLALLMPAAAAAWKVGIVADRFDAAFSRDRDALVTEVKQLAATPSAIRFPAALQAEGGGEPARIRQALARLQDDEGVDMIVVLGALAGQVVLAQGTAPKPTVIPFLENAGLLGLEADRGGSGIRNVNYVAGRTAFETALKRYRTLYPFTKASLLVDARSLALFPEIAGRAVASAKAQGVALEVLPVDRNGTAGGLRAAEGAVLVADLSTLEPASRGRLMQALRQRHIPVFSLGTTPEAGAGVLASLAVPDERTRRLRRSALNITAIAGGDAAAAQPVTFDAAATLNVDMAVARALDIAPPFRVLETAFLLHENASEGEAMGLADAAAEALKNNLYVIAGALGVREGEARIGEVRSVLLPRLGIDLRYTQINSDNVYVESGFYAEKSTDGVLKLQQILFSEQALAALAVQKELQKSREAQQRGLELEVVRQAASAFLQTHIALTLLKVRRENERLMGANLAMARQRVDAGMTDRSDVYRWESEIAVARQARLGAEADVAKAYERLNRILHRPISDRYGLKEVTLDDPALLSSDTLLLERIGNAEAFERLNVFFIAEAEKGSPDLDAIAARLRAERRQLRSDRRAYWSPDVALYGEVSRVFEETRVPGATFSLEDQTNWTAGVSLSLPLYEGGARSARSSRSRLGVRRLETERLERRSALEQAIRGDLHTLRAAYPSIALARSAAEAARKSYALVRENYALGTRTLAELLLAQNAALSADFGAVNTRYRFLIDLMQLYYDSGRFGFLTDARERGDFISGLRRTLDAAERKEPHE